MLFLFLRQWWNGIHVGLRSQCRKDWEFKSLSTHQLRSAHTVGPDTPWKAELIGVPVLSYLRMNSSTRIKLPCSVIMQALTHFSRFGETGDHQSLRNSGCWFESSRRGHSLLYKCKKRHACFVSRRTGCKSLIQHQTMGIFILDIWTRFRKLHRHIWDGHLWYV